MSEKLRIAMFGQKRLSREGGIEIVVKELATRMVENGYEVTCYNRSGHHVSGNEFDNTYAKEYLGIMAVIGGLFIIPIAKCFGNFSEYSSYLYFYTISSAGSQLLLCYLRGKRTINTIYMWKYYKHI